MSDNDITQITPLRPQNNERKARIKYSRLKRKILRHVWLVRSLVVFGIFLILFLIGFGTFKLFDNLGVGNIFSLAYNFITAPTDRLAQEGGRTNILIMGKAGGAHEGPDLTDTMIFVSVGINEKSIRTVSIPRDIWIPEIRAKINSAYYWGKQNTPYFANLGTGGGIIFAKSITQEVMGQPVQYAAVIDFSAFKDIVDALGGIQVNVENSFTDKLYPIAGRENDPCGGDATFACRYESVSFNAGSQKMNGDTALIFVRSRHAEGTEGTDIAREARQQKVIDAIKNKIMDPKVFLSPKVDLAMISIVKKYVETDIDWPTAAILGRVILRDDKSVTQNLIPETLLVNPPASKAYDNLYVFIPKAGNGNWNEIRTWVSGVIK